MGILQFIFICGAIYGLISFIVTLKRNPTDKYKLTLAVALLIVCTASFLNV